MGWLKPRSLRLGHPNAIPFAFGNLLGDLLMATLEEGVRRAVVRIAGKQLFILLNGTLPTTRAIQGDRSVPLGEQVGVTGSFFAEVHQLVDVYRLELAFHAYLVEVAQDEMVLRGDVCRIADDDADLVILGLPFQARRQVYVVTHDRPSQALV